MVIPRIFTVNSHGYSVTNRDDNKQDSSALSLI